MGIFQRLFRSEPVPTAAELRSQGARVIDVRSRPEFASGHVAGARNIDVGNADFANAIKRLDGRTQYVVYCQSGGRSRRAVDLMRAAGLKALDGGGIGRMTANGWELGR